VRRLRCLRDIQHRRRRSPRPSCRRRRWEVAAHRRAAKRSILWRRRGSPPCVHARGLRHPARQQEEHTATRRRLITPRWRRYHRRSQVRRSQTRQSTCMQLRMSCQLLIRRGRRARLRHRLRPRSRGPRRARSMPIGRRCLPSHATHSTSRHEGCSYLRASDVWWSACSSMAHRQRWVLSSHS
jgi:hypothetical protein